MTLTTMTNPPGLDSANHYTTALDFARLARAAMQNDCVRDIVGTSPWILDRQTPPWQQGFLALNTVQTVFYNGFVDAIEGSVPQANGVKGGSTPGAQKTGLFSAAGLRRRHHRLAHGRLQGRQSGRGRAGRLALRRRPGVAGTGSDDLRSRHRVAAAGRRSGAARSAR